MEKTLWCIIVLFITAIPAAYRPNRIPFQVQVNGTALTVYLTPKDIIKLGERTTERLNAVHAK